MDTLCAHCGKRTRGVFQDEAGERICVDCAALLGTISDDSNNRAESKFCAYCGEPTGESIIFRNKTGDKADEVLQVLYPDGVSPEEYGDVVRIVRFVLVLLD